MAELFIDTSAWYPAIVASHPDHAVIARVLEDAVRAGHRLVTTNLVVMETHALLLHRVGRAIALTFARTIYEPPMLVVPSTPDLEKRAVADWLGKYVDQDFSFTDAVSFSVMKTRGIAGALSLDRHFGSAGFSMIPASTTTPRRRR
ncbi:MAG: type II toxin-antitoxin system VapC family toxin [Gemmatimonadaceae bacterium]